MDVYEQTVDSSITTNSLYDENRLLTSSLQESVGLLETKRIALISKKNHFHNLLNSQFEEASKLETKLEQINADLEKARSDYMNELLEREDLERKNAINENAFNTQLLFQNAISSKVNDYIEDLNALVLKDKERVSNVEHYWEEFQDTLNKHEHDHKLLQTEIENVKSCTENKLCKLREEITVKTESINNSKLYLSDLIQKCSELKKLVDTLPFDEYKKRIEDATEEADKLQKEIHLRKTATVVKKEEIKRKKDTKEFELKHSLEELNAAKTQSMKLQSEINKIVLTNKELKLIVDELSSKNEQLLSELVATKENKVKEEKKKQALEEELNKFVGVEIKREELKKTVLDLTNDIDCGNGEYNNNLTILNELKDQEDTLQHDVDVNLEKIQSVKNEIQKSEEENDCLQASLNEMLKENTASEESIKQDIQSLEQDIEVLKKDVSELEKELEENSDSLNRVNLEIEANQELINNKLEIKERWENKLSAIQENFQNLNNAYKIKIEDAKKTLEKLDLEIIGCKQVIDGELGYLPEEYSRLLDAEASMELSFNDKKNSLIVKHQMSVKKLDSDLIRLENAYKESFSIEDRRADTIRQEIQKQIEKSNKCEEKCLALEERIKQQERLKVELQNRIVSREFKLTKAREATIVTHKELQECDVPSDPY